jgi:hypothetical protein
MLLARHYCEIYDSSRARRSFARSGARFAWKSSTQTSEALMHVPAGFRENRFGVTGWQQRCNTPSRG